jgi:GTP-binding protein
LIAISKADMLDEELKNAIAKEMPDTVPLLFISSVTNQGITALKDKLWTLLNEPINQE